MSAPKKSKALEAFIAFLGTTSGRDKSCRTIQYSARFLKPLLVHLSQKHNQEGLLKIADRIENIGGSMGMTRKVLRFGRPIGIIRNIFVLLKALRNKDKTEGASGVFYTYFKTLAEASLALFFLFDHVLYLSRLKVVENQNLVQRCDYLSNFFWLCECIATIISDCTSIHVLQGKLAQESLSRQKSLEEINEIKERIDNSILNIIRCIIDVPVALHFMNPKFLDPAFVGVLGTMTSLIGAFQAWPKK